VAALLAGGGRWAAALLAGGGFFWLLDLLIGCFNFILDLCIFLKIVRCQLMNGGQKTPLLHPIRMAAALVLKRKKRRKGRYKPIEKRGEFNGLL
jgi:hypothetical protein